MKSFELKPGHEIRGLMIRLYPDQQQEKRLIELQGDLRTVWNWLCAQVDTAIEASAAYAVREGLVPARPARPDYNGMTPEESKAARKAHGEACGKWSRDVYEATKKVSGCAPHKFKDLLTHYGVKHDYQLLSRVIRWHRPEGHEGPHSGLLQALTRDYFTKVEGQHRKKRRKSHEPMPVRTRTGECFRLGDFGTRRGNPYYDCQVSIAGMKIRGRLPGRAPWGRVLEGVSLTKQADGWWASIKQEVPVRVLPPAQPGTVIGIDVGLDYVAAMSDGTQVRNERDKVFARIIAERQEKKQPVGRVQQQAARHAKHVIYNRVIKPLAHVESIHVEKLSPRIGHMGSDMKSSMRMVVAMLKERYGERVREVECAYTSQDCSQCGHRSKETWSYAHGRIGHCPACGYTEDRDVNAARNIAAKSVISEAAE